MDKSLAVVGGGYWGKNLVRNFYELGVLRTVCDLDKGTLESHKRSYPDIDATASYDEVLREPRIKAVVIATPAVTHFALSKQAIMSGKDVFVEKPLAMIVDECEELIDIAAREKRVLMVDHILRYHPAVRKLKELVDAGDLGEIRYVYSNRLNIGKLRKEENILWSFAPHDISLILSMLDRFPVEVSAFGEAYLQKNVYDTTVTNLSFGDKLRAHIFVSWLHPFKEQKLVVVGSKNMAVFDDLAEDKLSLYPYTIEWVGETPIASKAERISVPVQKEEPLRNSCSHFIECVETRSAPISDGREGLGVLRVLQAAQRSLDNGGCSIRTAQA